MLKEQRWKVVHCSRAGLEESLQKLSDKGWVINHTLHSPMGTPTITIVANKWVRVKG